MTTQEKEKVHHSTRELAVELDRMRCMLEDGYVLTAAGVSREVGCSRPCAHRRIGRLVEQLRAGGVEVEEVRVREGKSGPESVGYVLVGGRRRR